MILTPDHPKWTQVQNELRESQLTLNDIRLSGKLLALKFVRTFRSKNEKEFDLNDILIFRELFIECGIGISKDAVISTHRALVFCQMKVMIDVIVSQVLG